LPNALKGYGRGEPLKIYLDTVYERATEDFFEQTIQAALRKSKHLIVVLTPATLALRNDGSKNWVVREIEYFESLPQGRNLSVAISEGDIDSALPAELHSRYPNIQKVDIREFRRWAGIGPRAWRIRDALLAFVATLHGIPATEMPVLREEASRASAKRAWVMAIASFVVVGVVAASGVAALMSRSLALERERIAQSHAVALEAEQLAADSPDRALVRAIAALELSPTPTAQRAIWSLLRSARLTGLVRLPALPRNLRYLNGDRWLLISSDGPTTKVVDASARESVYEVAGSAAVVNETGSRLATTTQEGIRIWDALNGQPLTTLSGASDAIGPYQFSRDGGRLVSQGNAGPIVWDIATGLPIAVFETFGPFPASTSLSPDGRLLIVASHDGEVAAWSVDRATVLWRQRFALDPVYVTEFDPKEELVALGDSQGFLRVLRLQDFSIAWSVRAYVRRIDDVAFSPDSSWLATAAAGEPPTLWAAADGSAGHLLDLPLNQRYRHLHFHSNDMLALVSANNAYLADTVTGKLQTRFFGHSGPITHFALSADGARAISASEDQTARFW
jgi:hypothetical protein